MSQEDIYLLAGEYQKAGHDSMTPYSLQFKPTSIDQIALRAIAIARREGFNEGYLARTTDALAVVAAARQHEPNEMPKYDTYWDPVRFFSPGMIAGNAFRPKDTEPSADPAPQPWPARTIDFLRRALWSRA